MPAHMGTRTTALKLAWQMTKAELVGSNPRLVASMLGAGLVSYGSYRIDLGLGRDFPGDQFIPVFVGPVGFLAVFIVLLIFNFVFRAPYHLLEVKDDRLDALERRLQPVFTVPPPSDERQPEQILYGHVTRTWGGQVYTLATQSNNVFDIPIFNGTAVTLRGCEAYLAKFQEAGATEPRVWESVRLCWLPVGEDISLVVDIPSQGKRSLCVFKALNNHVGLVTDRIPFPMVHMIEPKGVYEGLIVITAHDTAATQIPFRLICDAPENPPVLSVGEVQ